MVQRRHDQLSDKYLQDVDFMHKPENAIALCPAYATQEKCFAAGPLILCRSWYNVLTCTEELQVVLHQKRTFSRRLS